MDNYYISMHQTSEPFNSISQGIASGIEFVVITLVCFFDRIYIYLFF